jgi:hypothetical protein
MIVTQILIEEISVETDRIFPSLSLVSSASMNEESSVERRPVSALGEGAGQDAHSWISEGFTPALVRSCRYARYAGHKTNPCCMPHDCI